MKLKIHLIILDKSSKDKIEKSIRNIPNIKVTDVNHFSAYDVVKFKKIVFTESSIKELEKRYNKMKKYIYTIKFYLHLLQKNLQIYLNKIRLFLKYHLKQIKKI